MAQRFIVLDWDQQQMHLVAASVSGGSVRYQRAVLLTEASSPNPAEAPEQGKQLRERLKAAGISPAPVLACVGRERVILKEVRYPDVPAHEEPAVIRFQAVKELSDAADEVVIDYAPLGTTPTGEKRAQVLVIRRELLNTYQAICTAAGLKLAGLTPRPFGIAACLRRLVGSTVLMPPPDPADAAVAVVTVGERWAEFCIVKAGALLQTRTLTLGPGLAGEVKRNIAVHAGQNPQNPVKALYLALTGEQAALREKLVQSLEIPVHLFDPFAGAEGPELPTSGRGTFAGAVGLLHLLAEKRELPANFAQVKQPRPPKDPNQRLHVLVACLIFVLAAAGFVVGNDALRKAREGLVQREQELTDLDKQLAQEKEKATRMQYLHEWEGVPWPDELYDLAARFPRTTRDFTVRSVEGNVLKPAATVRPRPGARPGANGAPGADLFDRPVAKLQLKLVAPNVEPLNDLTAELLKAISPRGTPYYRPGAETLTSNVYTKDVEIRKRPPAEYTRSVFPPAAEQP